MPTVDDERSAEPDRPRLPPVDARSSQVRPEHITPEVLAGFLTDGDEPIARWALSVALAAGSRPAVYDTFVRDAMAIVGERWQSGRWTISEEHLATQTLLHALASLAPAPSPADRIAPLAVLSGVAGEEHAVGLTLLDHVLRDTGWGVANLGPNVPPEDLVRYVSKTEAPMVALTASHLDRLEAVRTAVAAVRALPTRPLVMLGGRLAETPVLKGLDLDWSGTSLREAADYAQGALRRLTARSRADA